jgi:glycosyltransferase involved in cell wall biosynthesis
VKTIAHVLPYPAVGGTEHATLRIAKSVDPSRYASIAFRLPEADQVEALFTDAGVPCTIYEPAVPSYGHARRYLQTSAAMAREFKRHRVDLVHCADLLAAHHAALAGWLARLPVLCHVRNRFEVISWRDRSFLWPVRRFVFVSRNTWQHFGLRVPPARGVVVYDGIDGSPAALDADEAAGVRRELGIAPDSPLIGMVARVAPQKDYTTLAKAAARVLADYPGARFLVVGDNSTDANRDHYTRVRTLLGECGVSDAFVFTGQRRDVPRILGALDVFVLSTHQEGLPLVILEAMSHGKPIVATEVDGIPEMVTHEETGLLFGHEDDRQLAVHILDLLRDRAKAERLGSAGRRLVKTRFSAERFAAGMNEVYSRLLDA